MRNEVPKLIFLVGFMGAGKSHEGRLLSQQLGLPFVDLDKWIEDNEGETIVSIFNTKGEEYFRLREREALSKVYDMLVDPSKHNIEFAGFKGIVATGGGLPCFFDNMNWMNQHGVTIWLNMSVEILFDRLKKDKSKRPLLANKNDVELKEFIAMKLEERSSYYKLATIHINELLNLASWIKKIKNA